MKTLYCKTPVASLKCVTITAILLFSVSVHQPVYAEVIEAEKTAFTIKSAVTVKATKLEAYSTFLNTGKWWNMSHSWFGENSKLSIAPNINGCFCEVNEGKQAEHMRVTFVNPNNEIRLVGALGPMQMMGLHGVMAWTFEDTNNNGTKITQTYTVSGHLKEGLQPLAPIVDQIQTEQLMRLASYLDKPEIK